MFRYWEATATVPLGTPGAQLIQRAREVLAAEGFRRGEEFTESRGSLTITWADDHADQLVTIDGFRAEPRLDLRIDAACGPDA